MRYGFPCVIALGAAAMLAAPALADTVYNNLTPNNSIAMASRPDSAGGFEIEAADDFFLGAETTVNSASFVGLVVPGAATPSISDIVVEMYRVFPADSNVGRTSGAPTFSTSAVPTRVNSPGDVAFATRDSASPGELTFTTSTLSASFTTLNSVQPGGIHPMPGQTTGGNGALTGQEVQFNVTFTTPFDLPSDHYFFIPQVSLTNGGEFYWLSASRPITGAGTTPFPSGVTDLQAWTRDANLDPDWLRVGTDIVGGNATFNGAFALEGTAAPEPSTVLLTASGVLALIGIRRRRSVL